MTLLLASAARATVGGRSGQEDAFRLWPAEGVVPPKAESGGLLAVLADGMGGHTGGAIAGQTACKTFTEVFASASTPPEARLKPALQASNEALAKGRGAERGPARAWAARSWPRGSTISASAGRASATRCCCSTASPTSSASMPTTRWARSWTSRRARTRSRARRPGATATAMRCARRSRAPRSTSSICAASRWSCAPATGCCLPATGSARCPATRSPTSSTASAKSTPEEMADGLIAAVKQKGVVDQDNTTVVAVRIDAADDVDDAHRRPAVEGRGGGLAHAAHRRQPARTRKPPRRQRRRAPPPCGWLRPSRSSSAPSRSSSRCRRCGRRCPPIPMRPALPRPSRRRRRPMRPSIRLPPAPAPSSRPSRRLPRPAVEPPAQTAPPGASPGKAPSTGEGQEGAAQPVPPSKSAATPPPTAPRRPPAKARKAPRRARQHPSPRLPSRRLRPSSRPRRRRRGGAGSRRARPSQAPNPAPQSSARRPRPGSRARGATRKPATPGESSAPRQSKELSRAKPAPAAGPTVEEPRETSPAPDSLSSMPQ